MNNSTFNAVRLLYGIVMTVASVCKHHFTHVCIQGEDTLALT